MRVDRVTERAMWVEALSEMKGHDFAHTHDFHQLALAAGEGEPQVFVARDGDGRAAAFWPVLSRPIPGGAGRFDLTSVYGYAGPLVRSGADGEAALAAIQDEMRRRGAVALFSRMHPLFVDRLPDAFRGCALGKVVVIDMADDPQVMQTYRGSHRREIVNAAKKGVVIVQETGEAAVTSFHAIYHEAMKALDADQCYFFSRDYLEAMRKAEDFRTLFFFASLDGTLIAASTFVVTGDVMQYYLSGSLSEFRRYAASKAIIAAAHRVAVDMGLSKIILGGGVGSRQDALFEFKRGFSPVTEPFHVMRCILDSDAYGRLCKERGVDPDQETFFPAYRAAPKRG